jgi:flagellar biosynthesis anti-sigma factor FlgM
VGRYRIGENDIMKLDPRILFQSNTDTELIKKANQSVDQGQARSKTEGLSSPLSEDTVTLSSTLGEAQRLAARVANVPELREDRVRSLQQRIQDGKYKLDNEKIADAIVTEHRRLNVRAWSRWLSMPEIPASPTRGIDSLGSEPDKTDEQGSRPLIKRLPRDRRTPEIEVDEEQTHQLDERAWKVNAETSRLLDLLEQRICLLTSVAEALQAARADVVQLDINGLEERIQTQERLCAEIVSLDRRIDTIQQHCRTRMNHGKSTPEEGVSDRLRETLDRLNRVQMNVKTLNEQHRILLARSRRTVGALLNSWQSFAATYSNPGTTNDLMGERL